MWLSDSSWPMVGQFCCGGLNFGYFYKDSPIIAYDGAVQPSYTMNSYTASTVPGCRTPHFFRDDGSSLYDAMGPEFTLLRFDSDLDVTALLAAADARGVPQLGVYRNCSKPTPPLEPVEECEVFIRQWDSLQQFFTDWEKNSEANFNGTWNNYQNLEEFEELFRGHFRDFLERQVNQETGQKLLSRKVRRCILTLLFSRVSVGAGPCGSD